MDLIIQDFRKGIVHHWCCKKRGNTDNPYEYPQLISDKEQESIIQDIHKITLAHKFGVPVEELSDELALAVFNELSDNWKKEMGKQLRKYGKDKLISYMDAANRL